MLSVDIKLGDDDSDRLTNFVDEAIKKSKLSGVFDGDILQNVKIKDKTVVIYLYLQLQMHPL